MLKKLTMGFPLLYHILMALQNAPPAQEGRHHFRVAAGDDFDTVLDDVGKEVRNYYSNKGAPIGDDNSVGLLLDASSWPICAQPLTGSKEESFRRVEAAAQKICGAASGGGEGVGWSLLTQVESSRPYDRAWDGTLLVAPGSMQNTCNAYVVASIKGGVPLGAAPGTPSRPVHALHTAGSWDVRRDATSAEALPAESVARTRAIDEKAGGKNGRWVYVKWGKSDEPGYCMNMFSPETYSVKQKRKKKGLQHWRAFREREEEEG